MSQAYQGQEAPDTYVMALDSTGTGVDLSLVTASVLHVRKSDGTTVLWTTSLSEQSATHLKLTYGLQAGDLNLTGSYKIYATMTGPGIVGHWSSQDAKLQVLSRV